MVRAFECTDLNEGEFPRWSQDPFCLRDFGCDRLKKFVPRLWVALCFFCLGLYVNCVSQAWLQMSMAGFYESEWGRSKQDFISSQEWLKVNMPQVYAARWGNIPPNETKPIFAAKTQEFYQNQTVMLFDLGFLVLPDVASGVYADLWVSVSTTIAMIRFVVLPGPISLRWTFLSRAGFVWGWLFIIRAFVITITPLPNPYRQCIPKMAFPYNPFTEAMAFFLHAWGPQNTCQDVLFSGHTVAGTMWTLFFMRYSQKAPWSQITLEWTCPRRVFRMLCFCWLFLGWYAIIASHFHYSVDVFIGALLTFTVYGFYHNIIFMIWLKESPLETPVQTFLRWFEGESFDIWQWKMVMDANIREEYLHRVIEGVIVADPWPPLAPAALIRRCSSPV